MLKRHGDEDGTKPRAASSVSCMTSEPAVLTDEAIRQWAEAQQHHAEAIPHDDPRYNAAVAVLFHVRDILTRLASPASVELRQRIHKRRQEIFKKLCLEWHERKPTAEPPVAVLDANAQRQAYRELRADVMGLVQQVILLCSGAAPDKPRVPHYRPVKRLR